MFPGALSPSKALPVPRKYPASGAQSNRHFPDVRLGFSLCQLPLRLPAILDMRGASTFRHCEANPTLRCHRIPRPQSSSRCREIERSVPGGLCFPFPKNLVRLISFFRPIQPSPLGTASGEFLRPAASAFCFSVSSQNSSRTTAKTMYVHVKWNSFGLRFAGRSFRH